MVSSAVGGHAFLNVLLSGTSLLIILLISGEEKGVLSQPKPEEDTDREGERKE